MVGKNECEGCPIYKTVHSEPVNKACPYLSETLKCPCKNCLIKVVCSDLCEPWKRLFIEDQKNMRIRRMSAKRIKKQHALLCAQRW
jgi:hypothetical protein